jgi:hypothetical protein
MDTSTEAVGSDDLDARRPPATKRRAIGAARAALALLLLSLLGAGALSMARPDLDLDVRGSELTAAPPAAGLAPIDAAALRVASESTDGVLTIVIPPGMAASQAAGGPDLAMPPVIRLRAGDEIAIRNDDTVPHIVLYAVVPPGTTHRRTFDEPDTEVFTAGCSPVHAVGGPGASLTTLMVRE